MKASKLTSSWWIPDLRSWTRFLFSFRKHIERAKTEMTKGRESVLRAPRLPVVALAAMELTDTIEIALRRG